MASGYTILCVEGRKPAVERWVHVLNDDGHRVVSAGTRKTALAKVQQARPTLIVVDGPSLRCNGHRLCDALKAESFGVPLLALSASGDKSGPPKGADSHLRYPVPPAKLTRRVASLLASTLQVGDVIFDTERRLVGYCRQRKPLAPKQSQRLETLMRHPGQVLTRAFLMKQVWQTDYLGDTRTLDVHIRWLRKAIERDPSKPVYLRTVRGIGYRFGPIEET